MKSSHAKETKIRKCQSEDTIQIPKILDTKVEPLFSLPSDLMSPKRCKRKKEKFIKMKGKVQKFHESSYTAKRLREEKFRRYKKHTKNLASTSYKFTFSKNSKNVYFHITIKIIKLK